MSEHCKRQYYLGVSWPLIIEPRGWCEKPLECYDNPDWSMQNRTWALNEKEKDLMASRLFLRAFMLGFGKFLESTASETSRMSQPPE